MATCPKCQREVGEAKFCRYCGQPLTRDAPAAEAAAEAAVGDYLPSDLLARTVRPGEMRGLLSKTLVIEEGQVALLMVGGQNDATLGPGRHSIGNILSSKGRNTSVVLFRTSDVSLETSVTGLMTSDPLPLAMDFRVTLKVATPSLLLHNLMSGADSYSVQNLTSALYPLLEEGCASFVNSRSIKDLEAHRDPRGELQIALSAHLRQALDRWGLALLLVQAVRIRSEVWDKITESRTDYLVAASEEEARLEGRKRLFDVYQESELQELAQETARVVGVEKRVGLWKRLRQALQANARDEVRSQAELEDMVREADKDRLLKDDERESLVRTVVEAKEDHQKARAFALKRVEAEGEFELKKLALGHRFGLEEERLAFEVSTAREEMEAQSQLGLRRLDLEIARERRLAEFRREEEAETQEAGHRGAVGEARTAATIADIEREQDERDVDMALGIYDRYKQVKREDETARQSADLDAEERRLSMELEREGRQVEMRLKESRARHDQELQRIEALSQVGIETLIAVSGTEQAQLLAQLARTRALSGSSPEQIMAMQAAESPQVANALKEVLTATAASGQLEQYERLVTELKDSASMSREDYQANMRTMNEMFNKALDTVKDTAVAFSGQARPAAEG